MNDIHFRFASTVFAALPFATHTHTGRQPKDSDSDSSRMKLGWKKNGAEEKASGAINVEQLGRRPSRNS